MVSGEVYVPGARLATLGNGTIGSTVPEAHVFPAPDQHVLESYQVDVSFVENTPPLDNVTVMDC